MRASGTASKAGAHRRRPGASNGVAGHHGANRRLGAIGRRLLLPVAVACAGLIVGGAVQVAGSIETAREAQRTRVLIDAVAAVALLVDQIEQEVAETNALRERGQVVGVQLLTAQRSRTDRALAEYITASRAALAQAPQLTRATRHVTQLLEPFARARHSALGPEVRLFGFDDAVEQLNAHLLDLAAAIAEQVTEPELANLARSVQAVAVLEHLAARQRDLLRMAFTRRELLRSDLIILARLHGEEQARISEFIHTANDDARRRFVTLLDAADVEASRAMRDAVILDGDDPATLNVDVDVWYVAQSGTMRRLRTLGLELTDSLVQTAEAHQASARTSATLIGTAAAVVVLGTITGGGMLAVRTTRRLQRLSRGALSVARSELPTAVAQVASADNPDRVREFIGASHQRVDTMMDSGTDEVAEVSAAIGVVHQQALHLAAEQALLRMEVSALFVALARRGRSLVYRQLELIDEFESNEVDPDNLARLFAIDHLAARMRRNEENLLVLAGGEPGHRFDRPVVLTDVVRAAAAEIEDYARVDPPAADHVWVAAHTVGDMIHLLAELLDNAAAFSPPDSRVRVLVERQGVDVLVSIIDTGIGMPDTHLAEANHRLTHPTALTSALVGTMGLLVVARMARRHDLQVHLRRNAEGGITAAVRLHDTVLAAPPPGAGVLPSFGPLPPIGASGAPGGAPAPPAPAGGQGQPPGPVPAASPRTSVPVGMGSGAATPVPAPATTPVPAPRATTPTSPAPATPTAATASSAASAASAASAQSAPVRPVPGQATSPQPVPGPRGPHQPVPGPHVPAQRATDQPAPGQPTPQQPAPAQLVPHPTGPQQPAPAQAMPRLPVPGSRLPVPAPRGPETGEPDHPAPTVVTQTAKGLPMRQPGAFVPAAEAGGARRSAAAPGPPGAPGQAASGAGGAARADATPLPAPANDVFLDPETVRARLSSLAAGIDAASRRHGMAPPGNPPLGANNIERTGGTPDQSGAAKAGSDKSGSGRSGSGRNGSASGEAAKAEPGPAEQRKAERGKTERNRTVGTK